jgi:hypothetical protein
MTTVEIFTELKKNTDLREATTTGQTMHASPSPPTHHPPSNHQISA